MKKALLAFGVLLMCGVAWSQASPPLYEEESLPSDLSIGGETTKPRKPKAPATMETPATSAEKVNAKPVTLPPAATTPAPAPAPVAPPPPPPPPPPAEPEKTLPSNIPVVTPPSSATIPPPPAPSIPAPTLAPTMPPVPPVPPTMPSPMPQIPTAMPEGMPPQAEPMPPDMAEPMPPAMPEPMPPFMPASAPDAGPAKDAGSDRYSALAVTFQIYSENFLDTQDMMDVFKLFARAGEGVGVIVTPINPQMQMSVELLGEGGELLSQTQAPNPGAPISFQTSPLDKNSVIYIQIRDMNLMMGVAPAGEMRKYSLELKPITAPEPPPPPTAMEGSSEEGVVPEEPLPPEGEEAPGFFSDPLMRYGLIGLGVLAAVLAVMILLRKRRAKTQAEEEEEAQPAEEAPKDEEEQGGGPPHAE